MAVSRRSFLKGVGLGGMAVRIGLPPLAAMFNSSGTAYAAKTGTAPIESRFVLWFNGNGIVENYWVPRELGTDYNITPSLKPLEPFKKDIHIITGLDNPNGKGHHGAMSSLMSGQAFTGRGAGGPSIDQVIGQKIGNESRFRSLQIGACQESFGESIQRNMSWAERDRPRIAKLQSDLLVHALASRQTRVASYMLTKCQSLTRFPWLGHTNQHHAYTHQGAATPEGQRIMRDINRWHAEEFAYLLAKLKSIPEGEGNLLDHTLLVYVHEHAEANSHKTSGMSAILAGHAGNLKTGMHSSLTGTVGDLYLTLADEVMGAQAGKFPSASNKLSDLV